MSDAQRLGLLGRRGPVTGADLPAVEARGQGLMDNAMTVAGAVNPVGIRAFHGSPNKFEKFDTTNESTWFSVDEQTAKNFGKDRMRGVGINNPRFGGNARVWRDAKPEMYEVNINAENLLTVDPMKEARKIAKQIGTKRPQTWDDAAVLLNWGEAQKLWLDEAKSAGKGGVLFKNVGDDPMGLVSDHIAVIDHKLIDLLRRYGLLGMVGGGAAAAGNKNKQAPAEEQTDYAQGGSVDSAPVYDPAVIAAIAASITEDDHA
jgi:hypothetical protein